MRQVGSFEAKTHLSGLLDEVARGESVVITKRGRPVARLVPIEPAAGDPQAARVAAMRAARDAFRRAWTGPPMTVEDILSARDEGRR